MTSSRRLGQPATANKHSSFAIYNNNKNPFNGPLSRTNRSLPVFVGIIIIIIYLLRQMAAHIKYTNQYTKNTQYTV